MRSPTPVTSVLLAVPLAAIASFTSVGTARAQHAEPIPGPEEKPEYQHYYIGVDGREIFTNPADPSQFVNNPNYNRLTFLFAHTVLDETNNHFHGIGSYSFIGDPLDNQISDTNFNNRIPETYTGLPPITLLPGKGIFADQLISKDTPSSEYTNLTMKPVASLLDIDDSGAQAFYNSSGGRWQGLLGDAAVALELLSITDGLKVADSTGADLFSSIGDRYIIGSGDNFSFTPTFYTDKSAPLGTYTAEFRLVDVNEESGRTPLGSSGRFFLDFQVESVPEPSTLLGLTTLGLLAFFKKHPRKGQAD